MGIPFLTHKPQNFRATKGSWRQQPECLHGCSTSANTRRAILSVRLSSEHASLESTHYKYSFPEYHYWSRSNEIADNMAPGYKSTTYPNAYRWSLTALLVFHYQSEMGSLKHRGKAEEKVYQWVMLTSDSSENAFQCCNLKKIPCFHVRRWVDTAFPHRTKIKKQRVQPPALPSCCRKDC